MKKPNIAVNIICGLIVLSGIFLLCRIYSVASTGSYKGVSLIDGSWVDDVTNPLGLRGFDKKFNLSDYGDLPLPIAISYDQGKNSVVLYLDRDATDMEKKKINNYFMAILSMPQKDVWVNLQYKDPRVSSYLAAQSTVGADLIAADYLMKGLVSYYRSQPTFMKEQSVFCERLYGRSDFNAYYGIRSEILSSDVVLTVDPYKHIARIDTADIKIIQELIDASVERSSMYDAFKDDYFFLITKYVKNNVEEQVRNNISFSSVRQIHRCLILANWLRTEYPFTRFAKYAIEKDNINVCIDIKDKYEESYNKFYYFAPRISKNKYGQRRIEIWYNQGGVSFRSMKKPMTREEEVDVLKLIDGKYDNTMLIDLDRSQSSDTGEHLWKRYTDGKNSRLHYIIRRIAVIFGFATPVEFSRPDKTGGISF